MSYEKSDKLLELIEGKSVVLVGPAPYLIGKNLGPIINNYDIVCRVNYMAPNNFISDYGNRTDIFFYNCCTISLEKMKKHFEDCPEVAKKMKLVVCPTIKVLGPEKWTEWDLDYISPVVGNFNSINIYNNDFHWIGIRNYRYLFDLINCPEPNSGILALSIILEHNPKDLFVTGFSFYANKDQTHFDNYPLLPSGWKGVSGHPQQEQIEFFKKCISDRNVKIDSYLNKLLKIDHKNIQNI
jgi:hypothetical protein